MRTFASLFVSALLIAAAAALTTDGYPQCTQAYNAPEITAPYAAGLCHSPERPRTALPVTGTVPQWLRGSTFYRNLPAVFQFGHDQVRHWLDALGQVAAIEFETDGTASIRTRFINTTSFHTCNTTQTYPFLGAGTKPHPGMVDFSKKPSAAAVKKTKPSKKAVKQTPEVGGFGPNMALNTDVNFMAFAGKLFAVTDQDVFVELDPETLETRTPAGYRFNDTLTTWIQGQAASQAMAHGAFDEEAGEYFNIAADTVTTMIPFGKASYRFYRIRSSVVKNEKVWRRELLTTIELTKAKYSHSLGLSKNFVVWMELPLAINEWGLMVNEPIMSNFEDLSKTEPLKFHVISRENGTHHVVDAPMDFGCAFHTGNVYEEADGSIVYYASRTQHCEIFKYLEIDSMLTEPETVAELFTSYRLAKCVINPNTWTANCTDIVKDSASGFPWYNKQFHQKPTRWAFLSNLLDNSTTMGSVKKIDTQTGAIVAKYTKPNVAMHEAMFIPSSQSYDLPASAEDDGLLMTIQLSLTTKTTSIVALDAKTFAEVFKVAMPFALPWHYHGILCQPSTSQPGDRFCVWN